MQLVGQRGERHDGPIGSIVQRLAHRAKEVAEHARRKVLVANLHLALFPGEAHRGKEWGGAQFQEVDRPPASPFCLEDPFETVAVELADCLEQVSKPRPSIRSVWNRVVRSWRSAGWRERLEQRIQRTLRGRQDLGGTVTLCDGLSRPA
jgi:hypothetical protein